MDYTPYGNLVEEVDFDGNMVSAHIGVDMEPRVDLVTGLALAINASEVDYQTGKDHKLYGREGTYKLGITSVHPYVGWSPSDRLDVWASVGYGRGERRIEPKGEEAMVDSSGYAGLAGGARFQVWEADASQVSLKAEGAAAKFMDVDMQQARLATEASRKFFLESGVLSTALETGLRLRSQEAAGVELRGSLKWLPDTPGLSTSANARVLLAGGDQREWGLGGSLRYQPRSNGEGVNIVLEPSIGMTDSRFSELWSFDNAGLAFSGAPKAQMRGEISYGILRTAALLTPYSDFSLSEGSLRALGLGLRYHLPSSLEADLRGEQKRSASGSVDHRIGLQLETTF